MMRHEGQEISAPRSHLGSGDPEHLTSAQLLRRHAQDLIEAAERLLAQAEAELETAYAMVSPGGTFGRPAEQGQT